jgi:pimeloyl-ACP methyl ester carboxylesterase
MSDRNPFKLSSAERDRQMDEKLRNDFFSEQGKTNRKKSIRIFFCIMLAATVFMSLLNWGVITGWGNVKVQRLYLSGYNGDQISALLYIPKNATNETPAPLLFNTHGNAGNARNHESWAVEFARRGFVVISVDCIGAGDSENHIYTGNTSLPSMVSVAEPFYQHALSLPYVDKDNILTAGHSMGAGMASSIAVKYNAKGFMLASGDIGTFVAKSLNPITRADSGPIPGAEEYVEGLKNYTGNILLLFGDVERTEEVLCGNVMEHLAGRPGYEGVEYTQIGQIAGSFEAGNAVCALRDEKRIHEAAFVNSGTIENLLWFGQEAIGDAVPQYIDPSDQIWQMKDYIGLFSIFLFGLFICSVALLLIEEIPFFEEVKRPIARNIGLRKQGLAISVALSLVFPYIVLKTGAMGIIALTGLTIPTRDAVPVAGFRLMFANVPFGVLVGLNLWGILGFLLYLVTDGRRHKLTLSDLGLTPDGSNRISVRMVLKSVLLAMIVIAIAWSYIQFQAQVLGTDFYAWFFGFKGIPISKINYYWWYLIIWIACFIVASFSINVERRLPTTGKELWDIAIAMMFNIILATIVLVIVIRVRWVLESNGMGNAYAFWQFGADIARLWGMPAGMAVGIGGSTLLYRKTGNTWLSAILMGTVAALMCVTFGQVRYS